MDDFDLLVKYVSDNIDHSLDRYAYKRIGMREPLPYEVADRIDELAVEWCENNGYTEDDYYDNYDAEDVFMSEQYDFDA
jgi:hypothetical protein